MQTIKNAVVVVLMLAVLYGVYVVLMEPPASMPPEVAELPSSATAELQIDMGGTPNQGFVPPRDPLAAGPAASSLPTASLLPTGIDANNFPRQAPAAADSSPASFPLTPPPSLSALGSADTSAAPGSPPSHRDPAAAAAVQQSSYRSDRPADGAASSEVSPTGGSAAESLPPSSLGDSVPRIQANPYYATAANAVGSARQSGRDESMTTRSPNAPTAQTADPGNSSSFETAKQHAEQLIADQRYREALAELSAFFHDDTLSPAQHRQLLGRLDFLAGHVIYSTEHAISEPYTVRSGDSLQQIAPQYRVPWQLLQKINGIQDPAVLVPGTRLKVVPGPFRAEVDISRGELTLFVGELYAGRFPTTLGKDPQPIPGEYAVRHKERERSYYSRDGRSIEAGHPNNPYGNAWLDLGQEMCLHGSPVRTSTDPALGCISLSPIDAGDVFDILSIGSTVTILP